MELSKYIKFQQAELNRSAIHFAGYNPRKITEEAKKTLKRGMKKFGLVGGIVVNKRSGFTVVGGHQRLAVMDDLQKYKEGDASTDYKVRVDVVDLDEPQEKELNILLNNPNAQGNWDYDALASLIPDIDWKDAGLTDADLNMIGVDYLLKTEEENNLADEFEQMMAPVEEGHQQILAEKKAERAAQSDAEKAAEAMMEREQKIQQMKDLKQEVKEKAQAKAENMDAYVMLSFDSWANKSAFMEKFGYPAEMKFIKGEVFDGQIDELING